MDTNIDRETKNLLMDFCQNCDNCLYPTEIDNELWMICKICEYKEEPQTTVIKKNVYKTSKMMDYGTNRYLIYENTYQRTKKLTCPNKDCPSAKDKSLQEAVLFNDKKTLEITYICAACNTEWKPTSKKK